MNAADIAKAISESSIYLSAEGTRIGQSFVGTALEGYVSEMVPLEYALKIRNASYLALGKTMNAADIAKAIGESSIYLSAEGTRIGQSFIGTALEGYVADTMPANYALKLTNASYLEACKILGPADFTRAVNRSTVYLGEDGSIIGQSFRGTALEGYVPDVIPPEFDVIYQTSYEVYSKLADDAAMVERWGADYESLSAVERYQLKEIDYLLRMTAGAAEPDALALTTLDYLKGSGKSLEELTDIDRALINFCSNKNLQNSNAFRFLNSIEPSENLIKVIKGAGTLATVGIAAYTVWDTVSRANKAIENDRPHEAAGIVIGSWCKLGITLLYGEELTGALAPYFAGAGMAIGGPVGAVIGGILAGVVGFGFAALFGEAIDGAIEDLWGYMDDLYFYAGLAIVYDPLVLDLDGDGFELLSVKDGVYFDEDAKGLTEKTEWISSDDALLAIDLNGDGIINDGSELFGTSTLLADGTRAENGFAALAQYDENQDGRIDAQDAVFSQLTVWQDVNSDGISQQDELFSLQELGITGISLDASEEDGIRVAQVELENGTSIKIGEFDFDAQHYNTIEKNPIEITDEISEMPDIKAIGNVASLHTLMQSDETGTLKTYVCQFAESDSREEKEELLTKILYFITGADQVAPNSRGGQIDAKKLTVIEQFMGKDYVGTGGANPVNTAAPILEEIYFDIYQAYYSMLNAQTQLKDYMKMVVWTEDEDGRTYLNTELFQEFVSLCAEQGFDMTEEIAEMGRFISSVNKTNPKNFQNYFMTYADNDVYAKAIADVCCRNPYIGTETNNTYSGSISNDIVFGGAGNDTLNGYAQNDILYGEEGDDKLSGGNGDDLLVGGAGDDTLYGDAGDDRLYGGTGEDNLNGGAGDDILNGGTGNDTLYGETGNDTYVFHRGDGEDIISDYGSSETSGTDDRILFGEGIAPEDVRVERVGNNLVIDYGEGDRITVKDMYYFADGRSVIENIEFSDGTKWTHEEIQRRAAIHYGTDGADSIQGYTAVVGYSQDETFIGGAGNDTFYGYAGNDTYIFHRGDGMDTISDTEISETEGKQDRIVFGEGITPEDVHMERVGSNLVIDYGEGDRVTVADAYRYADGRCLVENIEFADGTKWGPEEISVRAAVLHGTDGTDTMKGYAEVPGYSQNETFYAGEGNDTVYGYAGDDILYGEAGDDNLNGGVGDDILIGGTGNDTLYGETGNDTYVFHRGDGEDTIFDYGSSETSGTDDKILFGEGIAPEDVRVERVGNNLVIDYGEGDRITVKDMYYFADGRSVIENIEFADGTKWTNEEIQRRAAIHYGTDGADSIQGYTAIVGYSQDETFIGGAGNDRFYGYGGNDTYIFHRGDGMDTISDTEGEQDRIVFGEGITPEDVHVERVGGNLVIDYGEGDRVTVADAYRNSDGSRLVENIEFADGTKWGPEEISVRAAVLHGTDGVDTLQGYGEVPGYSQNETFYAGEGNDTVYGYAGDDILYGEDGDDRLNGGAGDDILYGGTGNDTLYGETGNDTYIFHRGDGEDIISDYGSSETSGTDDKILFGEGITSEDVRVERVGNNLVIDYGEGDRITVKDMYYFADGRAVIENVEFSNGTKWTNEEIQRRAAVHYGTDGADSIQGYTAIVGYSQDETFIGGAGNDRFYGYGGNDTYIFHRGDGMDTISDTEISETEGKQDRILFGEGITPEDVHVERVGSNLVIDYGEGDRVTVADAYRYADGRCLVENIEFADGTKWGPEEISVRAAVLHGTDGRDTMNGYAEVPGYSQNETFYAGAGNDTVYAGAGNDILYGEAGDDKLSGEAGDDILIGGTGNDTLNGDTGNDTYVFHRGDGEDIIFDYGSSETSGTDDKILFGEGITPEDVHMERVGNNLVIDYGEGDRITVKDAYYFADGRTVIENMEFSDGTRYDIDYENRTLNAQHNVSAAINEMVDSCVEKMEDLYAGRSSMDAGADEPKNFGIDEGVAIGDYTEADIDHMVNLLVQDMSEQRTDAISDSDIFTDRSTDTVKVQLWSES